MEANTLEQSSITQRQTSIAIHILPPQREAAPPETESPGVLLPNPKSPEALICELASDTTVTIEPIQMIALAFADPKVEDAFQAHLVRRPCRPR